MASRGADCARIGTVKSLAPKKYESPSTNRGQAPQKFVVPDP